MMEPFYCISIEDKNGAFCGIKIGTKTDKAVKLLKSAGATVEKSKNSITAQFSDKDAITISLKKGKVSSIYTDMYICD